MKVCWKPIRKLEKLFAALKIHWVNYDWRNLKGKKFNLQNYSTSENCMCIKTRVKALWCNRSNKNAALRNMFTEEGKKLILGDKRNKKMNSKMKVHPQNSKLISVRFRKLFIKIVGVYNEIINLFVLFWNDLSRVLLTGTFLHEVVKKLSVIFGKWFSQLMKKFSNWGWFEQAYAFAVLSSLQK